MIDVGVAATDIAVYVATAVIGYIGMKARSIKTNQEDLEVKIDSLKEALNKHDFILFGDDEISGYNGIQVVSYTNRAYLKQHHDVLVAEDLISENDAVPTVTPDIQENLDNR